MTTDITPAGLPPAASADDTHIIPAMLAGLAQGLTVAQIVERARQIIVDDGDVALDTWVELVGLIRDNEDGLRALLAALALKAPLASPALTGTPSAPTAAPATNTTQIATTAFAQLVAATLLAKDSNLSDLPDLPAAQGNLGLGMVLIEEKVASASATLDFETGFDGTYRELLFVLTGIVPATDGSSLGVRLKFEGAYAATSYQYHMSNSTAVSTAYGGVASSSAAQMQISSGIGNAAGEGIDGEVRVFNVNSSLFKKITADIVTTGTVANLIANRTAGLYGGATGALQGVRFLMGADAIASGTIAVYGVR